MFRFTFYRSSSGRNLIEEFLNELDLKSRASILAVFQDICDNGLGSIGCQFRQIEGKLWEMKIRTFSGGYRFFYVMRSSSELVVLHAYKKGTQRAPKRELDLAKKRLKEVML
jgi:phage-related protein